MIAYSTTFLRDELATVKRKFKRAMAEDGTLQELEVVLGAAHQSESRRSRMLYRVGTSQTSSHLPLPPPGRDSSA